MSPNKRKITMLYDNEDNDNDDDSFKHRRSSLRVNLSCSPNLSDSGNGSLKQIEPECSNRSQDRLLCSEKLLQCRVVLTDVECKRKSHSNKNKITNNSQLLSRTKKQCLQNTGVTVEDINAKEEVLNINCRRLKDAILTKTKEIFDKQNELSLKTIMILDSCESTTKVLGSPQAQHAIEEGNEIIMSDKTMTNPLVYITPKSIRTKRINTEVKYTTNVDIENKKNMNAENNINSNIITTPKNNNRYKNTNNPISKFRLTRKKLFTDKEINHVREGNDNTLKKTFSQLSLKHIDNNSSPILSGSNKRFHTSKLSLRMPNEHKRKDKTNKNIFISQNNRPNTLIASILEDGIDSPVGCSTFIEDNTEKRTKEDKNSYRCVNNNINKETHINDNFKSTQLTEIQNVSRNGTKTLEEGTVLPINECNEPNINKISENKMVGQQYTRTEIQNNFANLLQRVNVHGKSMHQNKTSEMNTISQNGKRKDNITCKTTNTIVPMELTEIQENIHLESLTHNSECQFKRIDVSISKDMEESIKTVRSSLHVNTSIDMVREVVTNNDKGENCKIYESNSHSQNTETNTYIQIPENDQQSINTVRMSLQVNTSLDAIRKCCLQQNLSNQLSNKKDIQITKNVEKNSTVQALITVESNFHSLETINLTEGLKDTSENEQNFSNMSTIENVSAKIQSEKNVSMKDIVIRSADKHESNESYIKGTPYPVSRTSLFKSQVKHNTVTQKLNVDESTLSSNINTLNKIKTSSLNNKNSTSKSSIYIVQSKLSSKQIVAVNETQKKTVHNTIILDDSSSITSPMIKPQQKIIIEDSSIADEQQEENVKDTVSNNSKNSGKRYKRKLLPLSENSQVASFSPIQEQPMPPKKVITKHRKPHKKSLKKKVTSKEQNSDVHNVKETAIEKSSSEDDCESYQIKKKHKKGSRKVVSKQIVVKKYRNEGVNYLQEKESFQNIQPVRRKSSLNDFETRNTTATQWHRKSKKIMIVTTGLSKEDKSLVKSVVKALGMAEMELRVTKRTTHVVSTGVRTANLLHGIIRGCWLVGLEWVLNSLESNKWLDPEKYEMIHFSKAVKENRKDKQLFGTSYTPELFTTCGSIYIENGTNPPCNVLKELVKIAGGWITEDSQVAKIIIGIEGLKETWILDSITTGELQSFDQYQKKVKDPI